VLDESVPFLEGAVIAPGAEDAYDTLRAPSTTVCLRVGSQGSPLIGSVVQNPAFLATWWLHNNRQTKST
jgi:hypothetical protein